MRSVFLCFYIDLSSMVDANEKTTSDSWDITTDNGETTAYAWDSSIGNEETIDYTSNPATDIMKTTHAKEMASVTGINLRYRNSKLADASPSTVYR